jgi:hypothetical protein
MQALGATCGAAAPRQEVDSEERWEVGARAGAEMNISRYSLIMPVINSISRFSRGYDLGVISYLIWIYYWGYDLGQS